MNYIKLKQQITSVVSIPKGTTLPLQRHLRYIELVETLIECVSDGFERQCGAFSYQNYGESYQTFMDQNIQNLIKRFIANCDETYVLTKCKPCSQTEIQMYINTLHYTVTLIERYDKNNSEAFA